MSNSSGRRMRLLIGTRGYSNKSAGSHNLPNLMVDSNSFTSKLKTRGWVAQSSDETAKACRTASSGHSYPTNHSSLAILSPHVRRLWMDHGCHLDRFQAQSSFHGHILSQPFWLFFTEPHLPSPRTSTVPQQCQKVMPLAPHVYRSRICSGILEHPPTTNAPDETSCSWIKIIFAEIGYTGHRFGIWIFFIRTCVRLILNAMNTMFSDVLIYFLWRGVRRPLIRQTLFLIKQAWAIWKRLSSLLVHMIKFCVSFHTDDKTRTY